MSDFSTADNVFDRARRDLGSPAALLGPLLIGGALAFVALAGESRVGQWLRGFLSARDVVTRRRARRRVEGGLAPAHLREMLLGRSKASIASRFGPPRTAVVNHAARVAGQAAFWRADTWYYAVDPASQTAMAVTFRADRAAAVEFFEAPPSAV